MSSFVVKKLTSDVSEVSNASGRVTHIHCYNTSETQDATVDLYSQFGTKLIYSLFLPAGSSNTIDFGQDTRYHVCEYKDQLVIHCDAFTDVAVNIFFEEMKL